MKPIHLLFALALPAAALGSEVGYYTEPALHGSRLVFVSEGDLWTATIPETDDGRPIVAFRLTASDGIEASPRFAPEGDRIAFAGQYDGNTDVYVIPVDGGRPRRLTFHPAGDIPLAWTPDGAHVLFRSDRAHHFGRDELWRVSAAGGMPEPVNIGECSMVSLSPTGRRMAFTPWSNERWHWKGYRGGTAPEIWVGDLAGRTFTRITDDPANDLLPMWLAGRIFFLSDRMGSFNVFSVTPEGGDPRQHTRFAPAPDDPTAVAGYDPRWASSDASRRGSRIVFCQGGALALLDVTDDRVRRLDVRLATDRLAARRRFEDVQETLSEFALSRDGTTLLLGSRGELLAVEVKSGVSRQLTRTSHAREWGGRFLDDDRIVLITDAAGEQQIAVMPADGSELPSVATEDREAWLFPPRVSADARWVVFADKSMRLHALDMQTFDRHQIDRAEAGEITDYRLSPDGQWAAYAMPAPNGVHTIHLYSLRTRRGFPVSSGMTNDHEPRWDPAGKYLYFLSDRHFDPVLDRVDFEHVYTDTTQVFAVPLAADTPPPLADAARAAGFDLDAWASPSDGDEEGDAAAAAGPPPGAIGDEADEETPAAMRVDTDGLVDRHWRLPVEAGRLRRLEAAWGSITWLDDPLQGLLADRSGREAVGEGPSSLRYLNLATGAQREIAATVADYVISGDRASVAVPAKTAITVIPLAEGGEPKTVDLGPLRLRVDVEAEWRQILEESWRLQRDFYWAPNLVGVDWPRMREKYLALVPRVATRTELNDVIGEMIGELGTSHTYIWGGRQHEHETGETVGVGLLGADIVFDGAFFRIRRVIPGQSWDETLQSPLAAPHLAVQPDSVLLAIDHQPLRPGMNVYDLLQGRAKEMVTLTLADDHAGVDRRTIEVLTLAGEGRLRYLAWVDATRRSVDELSEGRIGYLHIPDMGGEGLALFSRQFYPQFRKPALVIDVRDNGGGFVSQMVLARLLRTVIGFGQPRHGVRHRYPYRALHAHMAVLINQHAGSDGDIFPAAFRAAGLGPLIGTRTWGGVVGIRGDKPFVDLGLSTQPEFAWWDERGWSIENQGVAPDIEVAVGPEDRAAGRDPQLERAIRHLTERLDEDPKQLPDTPPYPVRVPR